MTRAWLAWQGGADTISLLSNGTATSSYANEAGFVYNQLGYQELVYSPAIVGAACIFYSIGSNYSTLDAYLTTETNLDAMLNSQVCNPMPSLSCRLQQKIGLPAFLAHGNLFERLGAPDIHDAVVLSSSGMVCAQACHL